MGYSLLELVGRGPVFMPMAKDGSVRMRAIHKKTRAEKQKIGQAHGRKRVFVYPPEISPPGGFLPGYGMLDWFDNIYPYLSDDIPKDPIQWNRERRHLINMEGASTSHLDLIMGGHLIR